jgi:hypothetical protein
MSYILTFIKEWVPSIAVIVGGFWLLFQWLFGESLRRKKEMPALDGKLSATIISCEDDKLLVTLEALWNNRSPLPLSLDIKRCRIDVFRIDHLVKHENCAIILSRDFGEPICRHFFLVGMCEVDYVLEPNTASTIINHFVLEPGVYGIHMELHSFVVGGQWWKELILDVRHNKPRIHSVS